MSWLGPWPLLPIFARQVNAACSSLPLQGSLVFLPACRSIESPFVQASRSLPLPCVHVGFHSSIHSLLDLDPVSSLLTTQAVIPTLFDRRFYFHIRHSLPSSQHVLQAQHQQKPQNINKKDRETFARFSWNCVGLRRTHKPQACDLGYHKYNSESGLRYTPDLHASPTQTSQPRA